jgi:hypothetical protein
VPTNQGGYGGSGHQYPSAVFQPSKKKWFTSFPDNPFPVKLYAYYVLRLCVVSGREVWVNMIEKTYIQEKR